MQRGPQWDEGGGEGRGGAGTPLESSGAASPIFINASYLHPLHTTNTITPNTDTSSASGSHDCCLVGRSVALFTQRQTNPQETASHESSTPAGLPDRC